MKEKVCGNCKSKELILVKQNYNPYYSPNISVGFGKHIKVSKTVCAQCGHVDEWITKESDVAELKKKYVR